MVTRACYNLAAILLLPLLLASSVQAVPVEVDSRVGLGGNDFIDWGTLGPEGTGLPNPLVVTSNGGIGATVAQPRPLARFNQSSIWNGNFAPGAALIVRIAHPPEISQPTISIAFNSPVAGAGAQVQPSAGGPFTTTLQVFDSDNNLLGSFSENGNSTNSADNSAIFLGVLNDTADIARISFVCSTVDGGIPCDGDISFALNQLDLLGSTPEPGTWLLLATSLAGIGAAGWRKSRKHLVS